MYVYDEYFDDVICPEYKALHYSTTNRDGYREYKSCSYLCADCPTKAMCTQNAKCEKTVTRHIWQHFVEMAEDVQHTPLYRDIYKLRQQKIERVFADAKEKHGMRYTQYRGLAQVTNWVKLKFAAMNLKKTGHLEMETEKSFSGEEAEKDFSGRLFFLAAIFPFSNEKACLGVIAKTDFFYRLRPEKTSPALFFTTGGSFTWTPKTQAVSSATLKKSVFLCTVLVLEPCRWRGSSCPSFGTAHPSAALPARAACSIGERM